MKRSWAFSFAFGGASSESEAFRARNLESPRALHSAVVMFQNNGGRKETLSEREDRRELNCLTVKRPRMITHGELTDYSNQRGKRFFTI